jgi:hypothetical protein
VLGTGGEWSSGEPVVTTQLRSELRRVMGIGADDRFSLAGIIEVCTEKRVGTPRFFADSRRESAEVGGADKAAPLECVIAGLTFTSPFLSLLPATFQICLATFPSSCQRIFRHD